MTNSELIESFRVQLNNLFDEAIVVRDRSKALATNILAASTELDKLELKLIQEGGH